MPEPVRVTKSEFYPVKANTPVTLSITIGDGQGGGTDVRLEGAKIGSGAIKDLVVGTPGQDLKMKSVDCLTTVRRTNPSSSHTSVTYALRGGVQDQDFTYTDATLNQMGDRAIYDVSIVFS